MHVRNLSLNTPFDNRSANVVPKITCNSSNYRRRENFYWYGLTDITSHDSYRHLVLVSAALGVDLLIPGDGRNIPLLEGALPLVQGPLPLIERLEPVQQRPLPLRKLPWLPKLNAHDASLKRFVPNVLSRVELCNPMQWIYLNCVHSFVQGHCFLVTPSTEVFLWCPLKKQVRMSISRILIVQKILTRTGMSLKVSGNRCSRMVTSGSFHLGNILQKLCHINIYQLFNFLPFLKYFMSTSQQIHCFWQFLVIVWWRLVNEEINLMSKQSNLGREYVVNVCLTCVPCLWTHGYGQLFSVWSHIIHIC